jgi:hypothetical protein
MSRDMTPVDASASPDQTPEDVEQSLPSNLRRLLGVLRANMPLYAVVDCARDAALFPLLRAHAEEWRSLYDGESAQTLAEVAPYLVRLQPHSTLLRVLGAAGWGKSWCVYVVTGASFDDLRKHLRHFLMVEDPKGEVVYFRFYDPRVLRVHLPGCNAEESKAFFGPIARYLAESEDASEVLEFRPERVGGRFARHKLGD